MQTDKQDDQYLAAIETEAVISLKKYLVDTTQRIGKSFNRVTLISLAAIASKYFSISLNDFSLSGIKINIEQPYTVSGALFL